MTKRPDEATDLDDLYLDYPASHLLNDTEAALYRRLATDWRDELVVHIDRLSDAAIRKGSLPGDEDLLRDAVEAMIGELCAQDTKVTVGEGGQVPLTLDLIEIDVRPSLLAPALLADGFRLPCRN